MTATREYMDEQYLKILQEMNDNDKEQAAQEALAQEIAAQDIAGGQATIYGQSIKFVPKELLDGKLTIFMPEKWHKMEPEVVKIKYPYEARPTSIMTDDTTAINFTANHLPQSLKAEELLMFRTAMGNFTAKMTKASFIEEGLLEGGDGGFRKSWFDFVVPGLDAAIYNLMFFTSFYGRALILTFNCLEKDQRRWKAIVFDMLETLKANDRKNTQGIRRMTW